MNTPSHLIVNLASLRRGEWRSMGWPIAIGALLADLPIFGFYFYHRAVAGSSEKAIWTDLYFRPEWQLFIDAFNSIPVALVLLVAAWARKAPMIAAFAASWVLHLGLDLPVHHDDAHRHFLPMTSFRFESPVSYWNPAHYGAVGAGLEIALLAVSAFIVGRWTRSRVARAGLVLLVGLQTVAYFALYLARIGPPLP